jgi:hypothetical protein
MRKRSLFIIIIYFYFFFFIILEFYFVCIYLYDNEILFLVTKTRNVFCFMNSTSIIGLFYNSLTLSIMC